MPHEAATAGHQIYSVFLIKADKENSIYKTCLNAGQQVTGTCASGCLLAMHARCSVAQAIRPCSQACNAHVEALYQHFLQSWCNASTCVSLHNRPKDKGFLDNVQARRYKPYKATWDGILVCVLLGLLNGLYQLLFSLGLQHISIRLSLGT